MSKHIVTINKSSLQDSIKFEGCSECQTSCQSACKTSCTIGNLICTEQEEAEESEELPPNTLSDAQYKQFLKNLSEYPLNVRLAFENLIVQDEFTDDAEFEIIEKILNKAPARQVASFLEKMLDTSIPVPRDFEHRTAEEYEAYKKSLQMMKYLKIRLTRKQYTELAKRFNLLSIQSLQFISKRSYEI